MTTTLTITSGQASFTAQNYTILPSPGTAVPDNLVNAILQAAQTAGVVLSSSAGVGVVTVPARRFVGTGTGSPTAGSWQLGDELVDSTGAEYECIAAGSPGTWVAAGAQSGTFAPLPAAGQKVLYVSKTGSDAKDGQTPGTAKLTVAAAVTALGGSGGKINVGVGTFDESFSQMAADPTLYAMIALPSGSHLAGAGKGLTTIRLASSQTMNTASNSYFLVSNANPLTGGDTDLTVSDLTIDGNGANQGTNLYQGIRFGQAQRVAHHRVKVINVFGNAAAPPGETFHFEAWKCSDVRYVDCEAIGTAGTQGTGFSGDNSEFVSYIGCLARGMSAGMGFTHWHCSHYSYVGCFAQQNGTHGFNSENSFDITYVACHAGGTTSDNSAYPWAANTVLGNGGDGFCVNVSTQVDLIGCHSTGNTNNGLNGVSNSSGRVTGGRFYNNQFGVRFGSAADATRWSIASTVDLFGNTSNELYVNNGLGSQPGSDLLNSPTIPATTAALTNPFPFDTVVYIVGGTITLTYVNGTSVGNGTRFARVKRGGSITLTYSVAPTWVWQRA